MNAQDEQDFVFACLLGAYIQALYQEEEGQQLLQRENTRVQQAARRRRRRMRRPRSIWVRKWLSEQRRQQLGHYSTFITRELRNKDVKTFPALLPVLLRTTSKFRYGLLRTVTFPCVHPVLLRPTRFLIRTVTAVANFLTV